MLSVEVTSRCSCYVFRQYFAVKRVQCPPESSAIFTFKQPKQLNLVPRFPRSSLQYDGSISQIIETMTSFWRHRFNMTVQQLDMVNYACAFSQSESGKYFEWIIIEINDSDDSAVGILYSRKKILLQHKQFVERYAEFSKPIRIPPSVMTFAVICSLVFIPRGWKIAP